MLTVQVIYPLSAAEASSGNDGFTLYERVQALDKSLDELMGMVRLKYLVDRQGGWDSTAEWGDTLSLGTQFSVLNTVQCSELQLLTPPLVL